MNFIGLTWWRGSRYVAEDPGSLVGDALQQRVQELGLLTAEEVGLEPSAEDIAVSELMEGVAEDRVVGGCFGLESQLATNNLGLERHTESSVLT